jgi:enoyl-CoA hydratase/carnithine racemase
VAEGLALERRGKVVLLTLDRPEVRNAADEGLWRGLGETVRDLGRQDVACLVVTGSGERAFMAGADIREFPEVLADPERIRRYTATVRAALDSLEEAPFPVVAALNGAAVGGGLELAVAADYRLAVPGARLAIPSAAIGLAIEVHDVERLAALAGTGVARALLLFGRAYTAEEGLALGLIQEIVERERLLPRAFELAEAVAAAAPLSVRSAKAVLRHVAHPRAEGDLLREAEASVVRAWTSEEFRRRVERLTERHG